MQFSSRALLINAALCCMSPPVLADVIYSYQGDSLLEGMPASGVAVDGMQIQLDFSDDGRNLLSWSASQAEVGTITSTDDLGIFFIGPGNPLIELQTDASGNVTQWYFSVASAFVPPVPDWYSKGFLSINVADGESMRAYEVADLVAQPRTPGVTFAAYGSSPGIWTSLGILPNLNFTNVISEPGTVSLLAVGLFVVGFGHGRLLARPSSRMGATPRLT